MKNNKDTDNIVTDLDILLEHQKVYLGETFPSENLNCTVYSHTHNAVTTSCVSAGKPKGYLTSWFDRQGNVNHHFEPKDHIN